MSMQLGAASHLLHVALGLSMRRTQHLHHITVPLVRCPQQRRPLFFALSIRIRTQIQQRDNGRLLALGSCKVERRHLILLHSVELGA